MVKLEIPGLLSDLLFRATGGSISSTGSKPTKSNIKFEWRIDDNSANLAKSFKFLWRHCGQDKLL